MVSIMRTDWPQMGKSTVHETSMVPAPRAYVRLSGSHGAAREETPVTLPIIECSSHRENALQLTGVGSKHWCTLRTVQAQDTS